MSRVPASEEALLVKGSSFRKPAGTAGGAECRKAPGSNGPSGASHVLARRQGGPYDNLEGVPIGPRAACRINESFVASVQS